MDARNRRLFSVCHNGMMIVMDADSGKVLATPAIGKGPDAAAFDGRTGLAFSSNGADGTLTVVKEESPDQFSVLANVPTQQGARTMALDPRTHTIYLVTARFVAPPAEQPAAQPAAQPPAQPAAATPPPQRRRPAIVPDSFVILVFAQ